MVLDHLPGVLATGRVHIANRHSLCIRRPQEPAHQPPALSAHADETESDLVVRVHFGRPNAAGQYEGRPGAEGGGGFQECAARKWAMMAFHGMIQLRFRILNRRGGTLAYSKILRTQGAEMT